MYPRLGPEGNCAGPACGHRENDPATGWVSWGEAWCGGMDFAI